MSSIEQLRGEVLHLPAADLLRLVERLLTSPEEDDGIMADWVENTDRRADASDRIN